MAMYPWSGGYEYIYLVHPYAVGSQQLLSDQAMHDPSQKARMQPGLERAVSAMLAQQFYQ